MNIKVNSYFLAAIMIVSSSANSAMARTFVELFDPKKEKVSKIAADVHTSNIDGNVDKNSASEEKTTPLSKQQKATPLARVLAQSENALSTDSVNVDKILTLAVSELRDNSGLVYLGGEVPAAELSGYLDQLKNELGEEQYVIYRQHQAARDHQSFHVTLINPYEYQTLNKEQLKKLSSFRVTLHGVGRVAKGDKESYFVVTSSADGQFIRQNLLLNNKDFHVTLGFFPDDIYGVSKGRDTLIKK